MRDSSVGEARRREPAVVCQQPPVVRSTQFGDRRRSRPRGRRDYRNRGKGIAGRSSREADEAIERANADLDDTIRQLGELGLLGRPASQETLEKLTTALDDAHTARARLGDGGDSDVIGPDDIDKLREPAQRLAAWRRLITDTVESVTVAPAMTADGRPSRLWRLSRIDIRFLRQRLARDPVERALDLRADAPRHRQHR